MDRSSRDFAPRFLEAVGKPVRVAVLLRDHSHFRVGGPADFFFEAESSAELGASVRAAHSAGVAFYVIGGGYNILFDDAGFRGLILKNSIRGIKKSQESGLLRASGGAPLGDLAGYAVENGLSGFEFLAGIPGTVGGAVCGNAGAFGQSIGDLLASARLMDFGGREFEVTREYFDFGYRHSALKLRKDILVEATFRISAGDKNAIRHRMEENLAVRARKQPPPSTACAGSYFKNPFLADGTKEAAGRLLEQVGAPGLRVGGAAVYPGHSNFIINRGDARAGDVLALAQELKKRVRERFGVDLKEEVIYVPAAP
jgi:UDP-N-acetylmuramate dehydrogenase